MFLSLIRGKSKEDWTKCPRCKEFIYKKDLEDNMNVCPRCGYHLRLHARERLALMLDDGSCEELFGDLKPLDFLGFNEGYEEKMRREAELTGTDEAIVVGSGRIGGYPVLVGAMEFGFRGGSMGSVVGEKVVRLMQEALRRKLPVVIFSASGGARMQEGITSLMQMVRTSEAVSRLREAGIMYVCVMTDPTMAGVAASFASLADVIIAEPGALIGFTGPRVIQQTIKQKLPEGFQTSEFNLEKGMIDMVVDRRELRNTLTRLLKAFFSSSYPSKHVVSVL